MFGYNVGVTMLYADVILELSKGTQIYEAPTVRCIEITPYQDVAVDNSSSLQVENVGDLDEEVYSTSLGGQVFSKDDLGVLSGGDVDQLDMLVQEVSIQDEALVEIVQGASEQTIQKHVCLVHAAPTQFCPAQVTPIAQSVPEVSAVQSITPVLSVPAQEVSLLQEVTPVTLMQKSVPDITGMTLKGQAQAIISWAGGGKMSEEVLVSTFGKQAVIKLVAEGYLIRTKKGILPGT